eukprot:53806-Pelagomonas_calceolata.AAC.2
MHAARLGKRSLSFFLSFWLNPISLHKSHSLYQHTSSSLQGAWHPLGQAVLALRLDPTVQLKATASFKGTSH